MCNYCNHFHKHLLAAGFFFYKLATITYEISTNSPQYLASLIHYQQHVASSNINCLFHTSFNSTCLLHFSSNTYCLLHTSSNTNCLFHTSCISNCLLHTSSNTNCSSQSFRCSIPVIWNFISLEIHSSQTIDSTKHNLVVHILYFTPA